MTRNEIRAKMLARVQQTLDERIEDIENLITDDDIEAFMWEISYGESLVDDFIDEEMEDVKKAYLEDVYEEIDASELEANYER